MVRMGGQGVVAWVVAGLMFGNAGAMLLSGWGLAKRKRGFFFLAIAVVGVNILLTVTDEFGLFDLIVLVIGFALLALLTARRSQYSSAGHKRVNGLESPKGRR